MLASKQQRRPNEKGRSNYNWSRKEKKGRSKERRLVDLVVKMGALRSPF